MINIYKLRNITLLLITTLFLSLTSFGSHIRAGEFSAKGYPGSALKYQITLVLYFNTESGVANSTDSDYININFGDNSPEAKVKRLPSIDVGNNTTKNIFIVDHTYNGASDYIISMVENYRNADIKNMTGSSGVPFYVEMQLSINPIIGLNSSPIMTVPPIDFGAVGKIFTHNPGAYDPDGDSISYELITSKSGADTEVPGYHLPGSTYFGGQSTLGGPAFLTLNEVTGDIVWNAPSNFGTAPRYYNIAIEITEWRYGRPIGYIVRDMQVEIKETFNRPPVLAMPKDTCIEAGNFLQAQVKATDPDGDIIKLESYGQPFELLSNPATINYTGQSSIKPVGNFSWQTNCSHVRNQPYQVVFKAIDQNQVPILVDIRTWSIYVKGPRIKNIVATPSANTIKLSWPLYSCSSNTNKIKIYRRDCDSVAPDNNPCKTGPLVGYTLIGTVSGKDTTYIDDNNAKGLNKGKSYCYILVASYPAPGYGESYPSNQICASLNRDVAIFSSVDVLTTSTTEGKVFLKWYNPSSASVNGPYFYDVERGLGLNPTTFTTIAPAISDVFYTDSLLDTKNTMYTYRIKLLNNGIYSSTITTFDLKTVAGNASASLSWTYTSPWSTDSLEIYRRINSSSFTKIKTIAPSETTYKDNTVSNCDTLYYYIKQYGTFCDKLLSDVATQTSAIDSVRPLDDNPPKAPALRVDGCNGDTSVYQNVLNWTNLSNVNCNTIDHYNVYFAKHTTDELGKIDTTLLTNYIYKNKFTTAGCYQISATNLAGVEGARSEKICVDDCIYYELPNLLTLNNDGKNDIIQPFQYPRGVALVKYYVYNRWGSLVYYTDVDPNINWNGKTEVGESLSDGVYYFLAEVHFYGRVNEKDEIKKIKGWLQILTTK